MIPARSAVTETLKKKILTKFESTGVNKPVGVFDSEEQRESVVLTDEEIQDLIFTTNEPEDRPTLSEDRRISQAVESFQGTLDTDLVLVRLGDFLDTLDKIVISDSKQKQFFAKKLRSFGPLIKQLRADGVAWKKVELFNREEFFRRRQAVSNNTLGPEVSAGDEYRGILRGLIANRGTRDQLELVLNDEALKVSERVRQERLRSGSYVPLLVIGGGVHSSIFTSQLMRTNPDLAKNTVVVEPRKVLGGQFRAVGGVGYGINSRTRGHNYSDAEKNFPGETGNINSMGDEAMLQLPDVEGRVYSDNEVLGLVAAMNSFLTADTALGLEVVKVRRNPRFVRDRSGLYIVELRDVETNQMIQINTDCVMSSTGLGEPYLPFDETDEGTQRVLATRKDRLLVQPEGEVPGLPSVATSTEFWEFAANNRNWQPISELAGKDIVIVGDADSTQTILEKLHGILWETTLDTQTSLKVASGGYDKPITVTVIGAKQEDYEEYINGRRVRYHFVALFYPRQDEGRNNDTITPVTGKATRLSRGFSNRNTVYYTDERGNEQQLGASLIITGTGFLDTSKEIFSEFQDPYAGKEIEYPQRSVIREGVARSGTVFEALRNGNTFKISILVSDFTNTEPLDLDQQVGFRVLTRSGIGLSRQISAEAFLREYEDLIIGATFPSNAPDPFTVLRDGPRPVGRQLVTGGKDENIFITGTAGKDYTFSDAEKESYPDATQDAVKILVNTDAIWRLSSGTSYLAKNTVPNVFANLDWEQKVAEQAERSMQMPERLGLPEGERPRFFVLNLDKNEDAGELPANSNALDLLKEAVSRRLAKWRLDSGVAKDLKDRFDGEVTLRFLRTYQNTYVLTIDPPLFPISVLKEVFSDLSDTQVRDIRRAIKANLGSQGSQDNIQVAQTGDRTGSTQRVIQYRPALALKFAYDGKNYNPVGESRKNFDLLQNAQPNEPMEVIVDEPDGFAEPLVRSEFLGGETVRSSLDMAIRSALSGEQRPKTPEAPSNDLRTELGVTTTSFVTREQALELGRAGLLTFENFSALIADRASRKQVVSAYVDFSQLYRLFVENTITPEQKSALKEQILKARNEFLINTTSYQSWNDILEFFLK